MSLGSNELILYADNTGALYPMKQAIRTSLAKSKRRSTYEREGGVRAWKRFADVSAKRYVKDMKLEESWNRAFTAIDRQDAAKEWEARFRVEYQFGELEYLLPEKMRREYKSPKKKNNPTKKSRSKKNNPRRKRSPYKRNTVAHLRQGHLHRAEREGLGETPRLQGGHVGGNRRELPQPPAANQEVPDGQFSHHQPWHGQGRDRVPEIAP